MRKYITIFFALISFSLNAAELKPSNNQKLANILGLMAILSKNDGIVLIRAPVREGECWGEIESCPDVRLFVVLQPDALGQEPVLFRMPNSKGWEFVEWKSRLVFVIKTRIPSANIKTSERNSWESTKYLVTLSEHRNSLVYEVIN